MGPIPTIKLFTLWQIYQHCLAELCPENTGGQYKLDVTLPRNLTIILTIMQKIKAIPRNVV